MGLRGRGSCDSVTSDLEEGYEVTPEEFIHSCANITLDGECPSGLEHGPDGLNDEGIYEIYELARVMWIR